MSNSRTFSFKTKYFRYEIFQDQRHMWEQVLKDGNGFFQPENLEAILTHVTKPHLAIDVGAHMGMNSMAYSMIFDRVVSFEPQPQMFKQAKKHLKINKIKNVKIYNCGLGNKREIRGITLTPFQDRKLNGNDGMYRLTTPRKNVTKVTVNILDSYKFEPDFIKIDVEGFEKYVLQGAVKTIQKFRPIFLIETIWFNYFKKKFKKLNAIEKYRVDDYEIVKFLKKFGYEPFTPTKHLIHLNTKKKFDTQRSMDTLFLPVGRIKK